MLGTSTRFSKGMIKSRTEASRMVSPLSWSCLTRERGRRGHSLKMTTARSVRFFVNLGLGLVFMAC